MCINITPPSVNAFGHSALNWRIFGIFAQILLWYAHVRFLNSSTNRFFSTAFIVCRLTCSFSVSDSNVRGDFGGAFEFSSTIVVSKAFEFSSTLVVSGAFEFGSTLVISVDCEFTSVPVGALKFGALEIIFACWRFGNYF